ncbi:MAG: GEVED domain-containing protein [Chitinophagaceae bacterium]
MKTNFTLEFYLLTISILLNAVISQAQCPAGSTQAQLNWDHIDFLPSNNTRYSSFYPSAAFPYNQNFTIGTRKLNFAMAPSANITLNGENGTNTAHAGSFATAGDDVQFTTTASANTTVTMTFDANVSNVQFSVFDLDVNQRVNVTAINSLGVAQTISIVRANAGSAIAITGSGSISANANGPATNYSNTNTFGAINITVGGPVSQVVLRFYNAAGDFWLGDINACVTGAFPNNYQQISRPFTGQPQYVLAVVNNNIYYVDPSSGKGYFLFNEPGHDRLNSMAYDPYKRVVYYTYSLTQRAGLNPQVDKVLKKYDVDSKTISVVIPDVNTFGIPTYESGVESGSATFYNGSLYLGIEGYTGTTGGSAYAAGRKSTIWKLDFDAAGNPIAPAAQVFGVTADDGTNSQNIHDWSDFTISDGMLVDFDGSQSGGTDFYQFNMMSGSRVNYTPSGVVPKQVSIGWDENIYNVDFAISLYNGTTGLVGGTTRTIWSPLGPTIPTGSAASWGDAAGPYRPFLDFGDAPATYDPDPLSPACHDTLTPNVANQRTKMILGNDEDVEWLKRGLTTVEDNYEDGLAFVPIFSPSAGNYVAQLDVFNSTGVNATVCAWLDFNGNGVFDPSEGITPITVPSAPGSQTISLNWPSTPSTLSSATYTYLRIRITDQASSMNINNATGYYDMGEVEDYRVVVDDIVLPITMLSFEANLIKDSRVELKWTASEDINFPGYEIQRSANGTDWEILDFVPALQKGGTQHYELSDNNPFNGVSYYRIRLNGSENNNSYSITRTVSLIDPFTSLVLFPNPTVDRATLTIRADRQAMKGQIRIINMEGKSMAYQNIILQKGTNNFSLPIQTTWPAGTYLVNVSTNDKLVTQKLVLRK